MSTDLTQYAFEGREVRVLVGDDGEPRFLLADLCAVLGIANVGNVVARLDADEVGSIRLTDGTPGNPNRAVVTEAGMYSVILRSDSPAAGPFQRWVTHEVLPAIRRTGGYGVVDGRALPQSYSDALRMLAAEVERSTTLNAQIEADAPKVAYVETYVADSDLLTFRTVAANLGVKESALRELLVERRWIYVEMSSRWSEKAQKIEPQRRYSAYADKKAYFTPRLAHEAPRFKGEAMHTLKITPAGASAIARLVRQSGIPTTEPSEAGTALEVVS